MPITIYSWNVNGIRAVARKGLAEWLATCGADVVALQETKARPDDLTPELRAPAGFHAAWNAATRPGYSGVATFSRQAPLEARCGLGDARFDGEGRVLVTRFTRFTLVNVYVPSGSSGPERVEFKLDFYTRFREFIVELLARGHSLVVAGDLNTAFAAIDLARPQQNVKTSGFLPEERVALGELFAAGLVDGFRALYPDTARYSWWSMRSGARERNIGWRLDYILVSADLRERIIAADTHPTVFGSDHCPVSLTLDLML